LMGRSEITRVTAGSVTIDGDELLGLPHVGNGASPRPFSSPCSIRSRSPGVRLEDFMAAAIRGRGGRTRRGSPSACTPKRNGSVSRTSSLCGASTTSFSGGEKEAARDVCSSRCSSPKFRDPRRDRLGSRCRRHARRRPRGRRRDGSRRRARRVWRSRTNARLPHRVCVPTACTCCSPGGSSASGGPEFGGPARSRGVRRRGSVVSVWRTLASVSAAAPVDPFADPFLARSRPETGGHRGGPVAGPHPPAAGALAAPRPAPVPPRRPACVTRRPAGEVSHRAPAWRTRRPGGRPFPPRLAFACNSVG